MERAASAWVLGDCFTVQKSRKCRVPLQWIPRPKTQGGKDPRGNDPMALVRNLSIPD